MSQNQASKSRFNPSRYVRYPSMLRRRGSQTGERSPPHSFIYPITDAGWKAWTQVLASFCICFCTVGVSNSFGVFQSYYQSNLLDSYWPSTISWIGTTQGFLLDVVSFVSGPLYDKGYVRYLFCVGGALNVIGLLSTSFATQYATVFLSFGIALGTGCGILYVPALTLISSYFDEDQAAVPLAVAMTGSSIGGIVYPILFRTLIESIGFSWACRVFASINGGLLLLACLIVKPKRNDEDVAGVEVEEKKTLASHLSTWRDLFDKKLLIFSICTLLLNVGIDVPFYYVPSFVREQLKQPPDVGDSLLAGLNGATLIGRLFLNWLSGSLNPLLVWQFTILVTAVLLWLWFTIDNMSGIVVFVICYGFVNGGLISLITPCVRQLYPDRETLGARIGIVEGFQGVGFLVGPPIAGAIMATSAGYLGVSIFDGTLYFVLFLLVGAFFTRKQFRNRSRRDVEYSAKDTPLRPMSQEGEEEGARWRRSV
ncbi:MFS general substrate transporter [Hypoxylon sp. FL1284]|nr:MFS general substrate transporter [Hypoxylon sp. FL1284]